MSFCPQCGLQLPEGSSFCYQCGTHVREGEPIAPHLEADATPPPLGLAGAGEIPRFTPHAADEPTCRFCKGPLDLNGEFCEQCGAPVSEAAPSRWLKPAAVAHPVVSKESSPSEPSAARLAGPPPAKVTSPPATLSFAPSRSAPRRPEEKAIRTPPLNIAPPRRADQIRLPGGKPGKPATTLPATPSAPAQATSAQAFAPKAPAIEAPKVTVRSVAENRGRTLAPDCLITQNCRTAARNNPDRFCTAECARARGGIIPCTTEKALPLCRAFRCESHRASLLRRQLHHQPRYHTRPRRPCLLAPRRKHRGRPHRTSHLPHGQIS